MLQQHGTKMHTHTNNFGIFNLYGKKRNSCMLIIDHNNKNNGRGNTIRIMMVRDYFYWFVDSSAAANGILDELQWVSSSINDFLMRVMMIIILLGVFSSFSSWNNKNPTLNWSEIWADLGHIRKKKQFFGKFHLSLVFFFFFNFSFEHVFPLVY